MTTEELISAMRAGSQNPLMKRHRKDLGRFGLGLKTASFSQCRTLTVSSKANGSLTTTKRWDLDYVGQVSEWRLLHGANSGSEQRIAEIEEQSSGTIVLWESMDRIVGYTTVDDQKAQKRFFTIINNVEAYLSMVFHYFINDPHSINIYINGHKITSWDPFLSNEVATQQLQEERLYLNGDVIKVRPYILPHQSKLAPHVYQQGAGLRGWNLQQGFYVYRNRRLLVAGDWLGLGIQKEISSKLARIAVDLPNTMDQEWDIDVRKSRARPPGILQDDLRRIARITIEAATEVFRHRGKILARRNSENDIFIWNKELKNGRVAFKLNRKQPLIVDLLKASPETRSRIETLLRLIEETIPVSLITLEHSSQTDTYPAPFESSPSSEIEAIITQIYIALREQGMSHKQALTRLTTLEPFQYFKELIFSLTEQEIIGGYNGDTRNA
jgi:hypothetical protein